MRVEIDADRCIGSGACVIACPEVFSQDEGGS
jgi:ferredoxin